MLYVFISTISIAADIGSSVLYFTSIGDTKLSHEFNPFLRGSSVATLIGYIGGTGMATTALGCTAWLNRHMLYPGRRLPFRAFLAYVVFANTDESSMKLRYWTVSRNFLVFLGIASLVYLPIGHFVAAVTNLLQLIPAFYFNQTMLLTVVFVEFVLSLAAAALVLFVDYKGRLVQLLRKERH